MQYSAWIEDWFKKTGVPASRRFSFHQCKWCMSSWEDIATRHISVFLRSSPPTALSVPYFLNCIKSSPVIGAVTKSSFSVIRSDSKLETRFCSDILSGICVCWIDWPRLLQPCARTGFSAKVCGIAQWANPRRAWVWPTAKFNAIASNK